MKKPLFAALTLVTIFAPIVVHAQQPPIIDRKLFFGEIEIAGAQISPDRTVSLLPETPIRARATSG